MTIILLSALSIFLGHIVRTLRWQFFLNNKKADPNQLLRSLGLGQIADMFIPWRLGEVVRVIGSSKNKNLRLSHSFASIIIERCLDIVFIGGFALLAVFSGAPKTSAITQLLISYLFGILTISLALAIGMWQSKRIRKLFWITSGLLGEKIRFPFLAFVLSLVDSVKSLLHNRIWNSIIMTSFLMWIFYFIAYFLLVSTGAIPIDTIVALFRANSLSQPRIFEINGIAWFAIFAPSFLLIIPFRLYGKMTHRITLKISSFGVGPFGHLPFANKKNESEFLNHYFLHSDRLWCHAYRTIHSDVLIVADCTGLSSATTVLAENSSKSLIYRKFQIGEEYYSLKLQYHRIQEMSTVLPTASVFNARQGRKFFSYDMPHSHQSTTFGKAIYGLDGSTSMGLLVRVLSDLEKQFSEPSSFVNTINSKEETVDKKINQSLKFLSTDPIANHLVASRTLVMNGKPVRGLSAITESNAFKRGIDLMMLEKRGTIHGDLTFDNIIVDTTNDLTYYLIDPATEIALPSLTQDLAKILQSTVSRQSLTNQYSLRGDWTSSIDFRIIDEPRLAAFSKLFISELIEPKPEFEQITLRLRLMIHWLRLVVHRVAISDPNTNLYLATLLSIWNNCIDDLEMENLLWQDNYCLI